ncbi:MAG TPA: HAD-IA family hydrolase [Trueperaceae bacterium]
MLRALVFDFDGTILDTEKAEFLRWQALYGEHGLTLDLGEWQQGIGTWGGFDPWHGLPPAVREDRERIAQRLSEEVASDIARQDLRPGVRQVLDEAREAGYLLAVATSSDREWVEKWLGRHGLRKHFRAMATRDDVARVKPNPELYSLAVGLLGVRPAEALAVEDSLNGATAAVAAGLAVVVVPNDVTAGQPFPEEWPLLPGFDGGLAKLLAAAGVPS